MSSAGEPVSALLPPDPSAPCPFCGGAPQSPRWNGDGCWIVECGRCGATVCGDSIGDDGASAARAWESRFHAPASPDDAAEIVRLRAEGWHAIDPSQSVHCFEAGVIQLWHRLWGRGVTAGYYHLGSDQWRGLDEGGEWFAVGIPPSHYRLLSPAPDASSATPPPPPVAQEPAGDAVPEPEVGQSWLGDERAPDDGDGLVSIVGTGLIHYVVDNSGPVRSATLDTFRTWARRTNARPVTR